VTQRPKYCAVFAEENKELLKKLPPPAVAANYYRGGDVYMFNAFQISREAQENPRSPACNNLYDVFVNIRDDEKEHAKTMTACQDPAKIAKEIKAAKL
jgi:ubiquinol oxidase